MFPREEDETKDSIQDLEIVLFSPGVDNTEGVTAGNINVQICLSNGRMLSRDYDLLERLNDDAEGQAHLVALGELRNYLVIRLDNEVLPIG